MNSLTRLLGLGLLAGLLGYGVMFYFGTQEHRGIVRHDYPELAWLRVEFDFSDEEFSKISELHYAYRPQCEKMCELVAIKNGELVLLMGSDTRDEALRNQLFDDVVQIKARCHKMMLDHFYEVSREMGSEQRERYLSWVLEESPSGHESLIGGHHQH